MEPENSGKNRIFRGSERGGEQDLPPPHEDSEVVRGNSLITHGAGRTPEPALRLFWPPKRAAVSGMPRAGRKKLLFLPPDPGRGPKGKWRHAVLFWARGRLQVIERCREVGQVHKWVCYLAGAGAVRLVRLPSWMRWIGARAAMTSNRLPGGGEVLTLLIPKARLGKPWSHIWLTTQRGKTALGSEIGPKQAAADRGQEIRGADQRQSESQKWEEEGKNAFLPVPAVYRELVCHQVTVFPSCACLICFSQRSLGRVRGRAHRDAVTGDPEGMESNKLAAVEQARQIKLEGGTLIIRPTKIPLPLKQVLTALSRCSCVGGSSPRGGMALLSYTLSNWKLGLHKLARGCCTA